MNWKIPLFKTYWEEEDIDAVAKVIRRGNYWTTGPELEELERNISKYIGLKYALSFNSGTSALHAVLLAHDVKDKEVIVPSFTFISTVNSTILAGGKPVFAEIEKESYGLDAEDVKEKINSKTKAIIPVHYAGGACKDIKALREIAKDHDLLLIEDAAESLGSTIDNKKVGSFGNSSMFSFCQNKIITSGEGGIILTDLKNVYAKLKLIRSHGRQENKEGYFSTTKELDYTQVGYNFRMSSITAALVNSQFKKIDKIIKMRKEKAKYYDKLLSNIKGMKIPSKIKNSCHVYQMYTIQFESNSLREKVKNNLERAGIMSKVYFEPIHLKTFYKENFNYKEGDLPKTEKISQMVLTLPIYPALNTREIDIIANEIKKSCK